MTGSRGKTAAPGREPVAVPSTSQARTQGHHKGHKQHNLTPYTTVKPDSLSPSQRYHSVGDPCCARLPPQLLHRPFSAQQQHSCYASSIMQTAMHLQRGASAVSKPSSRKAASIAPVSHGVARKTVRCVRTPRCAAAGAGPGHTRRPNSRQQHWQQYQLPQPCQADQRQQGLSLC